MQKNLKPYVISIAIALSVGIASALLTRSDMNIYSEINVPPLSPPSWLFPVVWTILYVLMGISSARVYVKGKENGISTRNALNVYALQLAVNFAWSIIFFNMRAFLFAFLWLILLWVLIIIMISEFNKVDSFAAKLQIPYLLWVTFAGYLSFAIWLLNK